MAHNYQIKNIICFKRIYNLVNKLSEDSLSISYQSAHI